MLKDKMNTEMKKFKIVEKSYKKIKLETKVSEASEILEKFLHRQENYNNLLMIVAESELKLNKLKK